MVTQTKSYELKLVESSNTILLLDEPIGKAGANESPQRSCYKVKRGYYEILETKGRVGGLKELLPVYSGHEDELKEGLDWNELNKRVQVEMLIFHVF